MWLCVLYYVLGPAIVLGFTPRHNSGHEFISCELNEVATTNKIRCPPQTCDSIYIFYSCSDSPPEPGCDCIDGYLRNASGICISSSDCPPPPILPICGPNEVPTTDRTRCPPQTCDSVYTLNTCELRPPEPGCVCVENYLRNASGICIPSDECPPPIKSIPKCGDNEEETDARIVCPPQTCESLYTIYSCLPSLPEPGCNCIDGYRRNSSGVCIPSDKCTPPVYNITCGPNEIKKDIKTVCPPQTCESLYSINLCQPGYSQPGCDCVDGFLRDDAGVCVPIEECSVPADYSYSDIDDDYDMDTQSSSNFKSSKNQVNDESTTPIRSANVSNNYLDSSPSKLFSLVKPESSDGHSVFSQRSSVNSWSGSKANSSVQSDRD